jgi:diadenosine tetraphosphatase ApaH/serine/threonine PP2A family protein phosphatase
MMDIPGKYWRASDGIHIDVRGLSAPDPMVSILRVIDGLKSEKAVHVHHFCDPIYLYPELVERGWCCKVVPGEPDEVRLYLTREQ